MLIAIPDLLGAADVTRVRALIDGGPWADGNATSGHQSALAKRNRQLPEDSAEARKAGAIVLDALATSALFVAAALPLKVFPPLFSRYEGGARSVRTSTPPSASAGAPTSASARTCRRRCSWRIRPRTTAASW